MSITVLPEPRMVYGLETRLCLVFHLKADVLSPQMVAGLNTLSVYHLSLLANRDSATVFRLLRKGKQCQIYQCTQKQRKCM